MVLPPTRRNYESALKVIRKAYGRTPAEEFRPLKLKAVREKMIEKGWCRKHVNGQVGRVKRMFKWAVENELLSADRHHALQAVEGLKRGRTGAHDSEPVKPVPDEHVTATLPFVSPQVAAMIRVQLLTGMRPGEVCIMRTCDLNRTDDIWVYRPSRHKNEHHAHERLIFIGPKAQEILGRFLRDEEPESFLFSAAEAEEEWRRLKHAARKTPIKQGNYPGSHTKRRPRIKPGPHLLQR
jgi:integrase